MTRRQFAVVSWVSTLVIAAMMLAGSSAIAAQEPREQSQDFQGALIADVLEQGWWDDSGTLANAEMDALVAQWGPDFGFAYSDRTLDVQEDPALSAAALLAQSSLDRLQLADGPHTLLLILGDDAGGATTAYPYPNVVSAMREVDRNDIVASFDSAASTLADAGQTVQAVDVAQTGFFGSGQMFLLLGIITAILALASVRSSRKKKLRHVHTADAKSHTMLEIQEMSDLILDLEPRVTIANDPELKRRYTDASKTYSEVLEHAEQVETGHDVADLRLEIAQARWKLDVIDAELDGRTPPPEPFSRDNSGSAWNSTRGTGAHGPIDDARNNADE